MITGEQTVSLTGTILFASIKNSVQETDREDTLRHAETSPDTSRQALTNVQPTYNERWLVLTVAFISSMSCR